MTRVSPIPTAILSIPAGVFLFHPVDVIEAKPRVCRHCGATEGSKGAMSCIRLTCPLK